MDNLIPEHAITAQTLTTELEAIAVDAELVNAEKIYVTGQAFNFWVRVNCNTQYLIFSTYACLNDTTESIETLRYVNELNDIWSLAQFSISFENDRLYAFYMLSFKGGLLRKQLLRTMTNFPNIFSDVVSEGRMRGLIECDTDRIASPQSICN